MSAINTEGGTDGPNGKVRPGVYHFLDMGDQRYGECILAQFADVTVLIDGGHTTDFRGQEGHPSIPAQLREILGGDPPYHVTLLVVTHGHADHVGCLPDLVTEGIVDSKWALVTDPALGFGRHRDDSDREVDERARRLVAALREEDATSLADDELADFIADAARVEDRYGALLRNLRARGTEVVRFGVDEVPRRLTEDLASTGMTILGPTVKQIRACADQIANTNDSAVDAVSRALDSLDRGEVPDDARLYRAVVRAEDAEDAGRGRGAAMNCQSITLAFGPRSARVLLAGDMQFTEPGVRRATEEVQTLRSAVVASGPYALFKTTHHTSHNGQDEELIRELGMPPVIVHSGGLRDPGHPYPETLTMLKALRRRIQFVRTDRNGLITVKPVPGSGATIEISKGRVNDFTDNVDDDVQAIARPTVVARPGPQVIIINLPDHPVELTVAGVPIVSDIVAPTPQVVGPDRRSATKPVSPPVGSGRVESFVLAPGRVLPRLLFVTNAEKLARNIGQTEAAATLAAVDCPPHAVCDVPTDWAGALSAVQAKLVEGSFEGVVLLGGYDVVPSNIVDVLGTALRQRLGGDADADLDRFTVWFDDEFGDVDGDGFADIPVSRIPDARDAALVRMALAAEVPTRLDGFGIRNVMRPFADQVCGAQLRRSGLLVSEPILARQVAHRDPIPQYHYFMLHGDELDARAYAGEYEFGGGYPVAYECGNVPPAFQGVVFAGCCWGALIVSSSANAATRRVAAPRLPERSIALSYLKAGANAFVGSTGAHYSGTSLREDSNAALLLHRAFWQGVIEDRLAPAQALFAARRDLGEFIASRQDAWDPLILGRFLKNWHQFTCLGLGW